VKIMSYLLDGVASECSPHHTFIGHSVAQCCMIVYTAAVMQVQIFLPMLSPTRVDSVLVVT
jgi:hypothetical protein